VLQWFSSEGWVAVLAVLNLVVVGLVAYDQFRQDRRIRSVEIRFQGILERITAAYNKIDTVDRRVTGKLEVGNEDDTKLKKAVKRVKNPQEFDDR
jgi:hypothetical protein